MKAFVRKYWRILIYAVVLIYIYWQYQYITSINEYQNGQRKSEGQISNGKNEGLWIWWYENGKKEMEGKFVRGKREGVWKMWDKKGNIKSKAYYHNDKLNGPYTRWYKNETKESEGFYLNDQLDGIQKQYDTTGILIKTIRYINGNLLEK